MLSKKWCMLIPAALLALSVLGCRKGPARMPAQGPEAQQSSPVVSPARARPVSEVIRDNLATWRFRPGKRVLVNPSSPWRLSLAAAPDGHLYLAWSASQPTEELVIVASSPDGDSWEIEAKFHRGNRCERVRRTVAIAANPTVAESGTSDLVAVAWVSKDRCFAARKMASGEWTEPEVVPGYTGLRDISLTGDGSGGFSLLAVPITHAGWPALISHYRPTQGWSHLSPIHCEESKFSDSCPHLGYRGEVGLTALGEVLSDKHGKLIVGSAGEWKVICPLPWPAFNICSLWIQPKTVASAIVETYQPVMGAACLVTSQDLKTWSEPLFLGWLGTGGQTQAVAVVGERTYVATSCAPVIPCHEQYYGPPSAEDRRGPHVFLIDGSLTRDTDQDGLTDITEEWLLTDYQNADTDGDGEPDGSDVDPLAASVPDNDEALVQQAVFEAIRESLPKASTIMVITQQRQAFPNHSDRFLSLTPEEAEAYRNKYGTGRLYSLSLPEPEFSPDREEASISWGHAYCHGETKLEKIEGAWVVIDPGWRFNH